METKKKNTANHPEKRVGAVSPAERVAASRAYVQFVRCCRKAGAPPETTLESWILEWVAVARAQPTDEPADVDRLEPSRDYRVYYTGEKGGPGQW